MSDFRGVAANGHGNFAHAKDIKHVELPGDEREADRLRLPAGIQA